MDVQAKWKTAEEALHEAERFLEERVSPRAAQIDQDPEVLREVLREFCELDLMALKRPAQFGGPELSEMAFRGFQESCARASGAFSFLQTQHQSAVSTLAKADNPTLAAKYLPKMGNGEKLVGIGFSQLRRPDPPLMKAKPIDKGYILNGHVPWVTGYTFYPEFLMGASLPNGDALFGVVPFENVSNENGTILLSEPMSLAALESALSVTADFEEWFLPNEKVVFLKPPNWIHENDMLNIALQGYFALGCARAGLDVLKAACEKRGAPFLRTSWKKLDEELNACRVQMTMVQNASQASTEGKLDVRAWAIELAVRCAHAAIAASGGSVNLQGHPAQRIYREALVYTVSAQTTPILEATLRRLTQ